MGFPQHPQLDKFIWHRANKKQFRGFKGSWGVLLFYVKILSLKLLIFMIFNYVWQWDGFLMCVSVLTEVGSPWDWSNMEVVSHQCDAGPLAEQKNTLNH